MNRQAIIDALNALPYAELTEVFTAARQARGLGPHEEPRYFRCRVETIEDRAGALDVGVRIQIAQAIADVDKCDWNQARTFALHGWLTPDRASHAQCQQRAMDLNAALAKRGHAPMFCVRGG